MHTENERLLVSAVLSGNVEAFASLVRAHQARVRLVCAAMLGNAAEADDAAQDVFVKAFLALSDFKGDSSVETWLVRIADNHCIDLLRKRSRQRTESIDALLESKGEAFEGLLSRFNTSDTPPPHTPDDLELIGKLFAALPQEDRDILLLREIEGLPYEIIAERLACSLDAVKGRLKRARQDLIEKCRKFF